MGFLQLRSILSGNQFRTSSPGSYSLAADTGTFDWSGTAATLTYSSTPAADTSLRLNIQERNYPRAFHPSLRKPVKFALPAQAILTAAEGAYTVVGSDAALVAPAPILEQRVKGNRAWPRPFAPSPFGQFRSDRYIPQDLISPQGLNFYALECLSGAFVVTGTDTAPRVGYRLTASEYNYVIGGQTASLLVGYKLIASAGAYTIDGVDATFDFGLVVDSGAFLVGGSSANLIYSNASAGTNRAAMLLLGVG